jgi:hypothetical protein
MNIKATKVFLSEYGFEKGLSCNLNPLHDIKRPSKNLIMPM